MALLTSELERAKAELGYNLLTTGSAYIADYAALFEQAVAPYLSAGAKTTSSSTVAPVSPPTPLAITLTSATGFTAGDRVVVDVDSRQEAVTIQSLASTTLTALFTKTHSGNYPVTVEGGESIVREKLAEIFAARVTRGKAQGRGALKAITGDIEWFDTGISAFASSSAEIDKHRDELAAILGVPNLWRSRAAAGLRLSVY